MEPKSWWQRPVLHTDDEDERGRRASWLELFFDLIFVVVIAELSAALARDPSREGLWRLVLLFVPAFWVWTGTAYYNDRFGVDDVSHRLITFLNMFPVLGMALAVRGGIAEHSRAFAVSYIAARLILIFLWLRGGWHNPQAAALTRRYAIGFSMSVALWSISLAVPPPARFGLWAVGIAIDVLTPFTTLLIQLHLPHLSTSHLPERFGLFTLIVLGESVSSVVRGLAAHGRPTFAAACAGCFGMALIFTIWWLYFDHVMSRRSKPGVWWGTAWSYGHLPLVMSLAVLGAAVLNILAADGAPAASVRRLACAATAVALLSIGAIEWALAHDEYSARPPAWATLYRFGGVLIAAGLAEYGPAFGGVSLLLALTTLGASQMLYGRERWIWQTAT